MVKSFADICFDHLEMLYPCLFFSMLAMPCGCLPFQPCHALPIQKKWHFCHPSSSMVCKCKPVSPVRGLSPLRGDLPQQRSLDGRSKGEIYVGITTLSLTQLRQTQAPPQPIVPFFKFQYHSLLLKQLSPPLSGGTNPVFFRKPEMGAPLLLD